MKISCILLIHIQINFHLFQKASVIIDIAKYTTYYIAKKIKKLNNSKYFRQSIQKTIRRDDFIGELTMFVKIE